jgi:hypothetical protein
LRSLGEVGHVKAVLNRLPAQSASADQRAA